MELEERDYYVEENVFWVPGLARWNNIKTNARLANGTEIAVRNGKISKYKFTTLAKLIDDALEAIEKENPKLKGVLNKMLHAVSDRPRRAGRAGGPHLHDSLPTCEPAREGHPGACV
jgi:type I restriction-modification system DNA methylase subunit